MSFRERRIEMIRRGQSIPMTTRPPVYCGYFGPDTILEGHSTTVPATYGEHKPKTHLIFLSDSDPVKAECRVEGRRQNVHVEPNQLWILPRHTQHSSSFTGAHGGVVLSIGVAEFERHVQALATTAQTNLVPKLDVNDRQLQHTLLALLAVAREGSEADALFADSLIQAVCIRLVKRYSVTPATPVALRGGLPVGRLKRVLEYINANLDKKIRLFALAETASMSMYHFAKLFSQSMGVSPHQYLVQRRIERAKELLRDGHLSVLEVSLSLGFDHPNNFARTFRRLTGWNPTRFRHDHYPRALEIKAKN
jgi:AraC family transcriptional regulator